MIVAKSGGLGGAGRQQNSISSSFFSDYLRTSLLMTIPSKHRLSLVLGEKLTISKNVSLLHMLHSCLNGKG
jgi:hypothetical protein